MSGPNAGDFDPTITDPAGGGTIGATAYDFEPPKNVGGFTGFTDTDAGDSAGSAKMPDFDP